MEFLLGYLLIFFAKISEVSITVVRTILMVRGKKIQSAALGVVEVLIFLAVLTKIMSQLDNIGNLIAYALGFGTGQIVGIYLEQKLALGHATVQVITKEDEGQLVEVLRDEGFGVTLIQGYGRDGISNILNIVLKRNMLPRLYQILEKFDESAFITIMETRHTQGGYMSQSKIK